ncbi:MAG: hypothetical protein LBL90_10470 [Prevotellaceae bacterium]|jgi:phenylacetate-CoA ligase|nr:hypothetical protein [Prevotellaceae bacterium]
MNKIVQLVYDNSPVLIQNALISIYGCKLKKQRYGEVYLKYLEYLKHRDLSDLKKQKEIQNYEFLNLLNYAVSNSSFYKNFYNGIDLSQIKSVDDIHLLPVLTKEILRENIDKVHTISPNEGVSSFTGGTTGKSLKVIYTKENNQRRMAYLDWFKWLHGFENGKMKSIRFNGKNFIPFKQKSKIFWRQNSAIKQRLYSTFHLSQDNLKYYVKNINKYKPSAIDGFCTSICEIANYMKRNNIKSEFTPIAIFPTSETILAIHRELLSEVFGAPVRDQYASSEGAPFIIECPCGSLHECIDTGVFEHINTDNGTKLIVTSFNSYGAPLIRYDIGDNIIESEQKKCGCGIAFPIIKAIDGRRADWLTSKERGNINLGNLSNVIKYIPNSVINIQFVQNTLDEIMLNIVFDEKIYKPEHDKLILDEMKIRFGGNMRFIVNKLKNIPRTKSGKYQFIINNLP